MSNSSTTLNDVCEFIVDCLHATAPIQDEGYPLIRTPNIGKGRLNLAGVHRVSKDIYKKWTQRAVPRPDDLILAREAPAGNVAIVKEGQQVCLGQRTVHLRPDRSQIDPNFLTYFLLAPKQRGTLLASETGATSQHVNMKDIRRLSMNGLPPLQAQKRIGHVISTYDDLIENNRRRIQLLEQAARLLYKEWFVHLRFPGYQHTTITNGVPEGWKKRHLSELLNTQYGFTETATDEPIGPKFLRGTDINKTSYIDWGMVPYCPDEKLDFNKFALQVNDIVVIRMADPGKVAIVETEQRAVFASYLVRLTRKEGVEIPALYLFYVLSDNAYQGFISGASSGSTRKSASAKLLIDFNILVPSSIYLAMLIEQIQPLRQQIQILLKQNASLKQGRDLLLPRLMNGEMIVQ